MESGQQLSYSEQSSVHWQICSGWYSKGQDWGSKVEHVPVTHISEHSLQVVMDPISHWCDIELQPHGTPHSHGFVVLGHPFAQP